MKETTQKETAKKETVKKAPKTASKLTLKEAFSKAEEHLAKADPVMKELIRKHGECRLKPQADAFFVLCDSIISQQISVKAAAAIMKRFVALFPKEKPEPALLLVLPDEIVRAVGCSSSKVKYLKDLAEKFHDKTLKPKKLVALEDEELIKTLTQVKGIGRWTAEMFLIFSLNRLDVMATDDYGLRKAMMLLYNMPEMPKRAIMLELAEAWKPYRSVASWYLWRSLDNEPSIG
ncbi:MAG: DNA-3-methyladenine glycosylase 2 family protein [Candidatus Kapaibacterium sp.]|nr:MAG: DNA-3-methyladenine glycosylase 2 family protein [Candidatus Kapabacteria bacterium]